VKKSAVSIIAAISLLLLAACSFAEPYVPDTDSSAGFQVPSLKLADPITLSTALENNHGQALATYNLTLPQFSCDVDSNACSRINQTYLSRVEECSQDCQSFFAHCKSALGESWQDTSAEAPIFSVEINFTQLDCPDEYICIKNTYTLTENDVTSYYHTCDLFLNEAGWQLSFSSLFGENTYKALELVKSGVESYCKENGIPTNSISLITPDYLSDSCGMTEENFFVCFRPYFFASTVKDLPQIDLPLSDFIPLLTEQIY